MVRASWSEFTKGYDARSLALIEAYRTLAAGLEGVEERIHSSEVSYARTRVFTSGYVKSHWLEIGVDLTREAAHPLLRTSFASSKRTVMHRLTIGEPAQVDDSVLELLREAWETVGRGFL